MLRAKNIEEATKQAKDAGIAGIKETARKTEEIIDLNNAKKEAAAGVDTPEPSTGASNLPPTGNPEEVSAPVKQAVNVMDLFRARQEKELEEEKEREARRLEMQRLGTGFAGLAASIGDMVRASEGAPVNPRDWQRIYDNLTAQEKANVNNYKVRMDKLREDARADRMAAAQAAAKAEAAKQKRDYEAMKWRIERDEKLSEADKKRLLDWWIANLDKGDGSGSGGGSSSKYDRYVVGDTGYDIPKGRSGVNFVNAVVGTLRKAGKNISITNMSELEKDPQGYFDRVAYKYIVAGWNELDAATQKEIHRLAQAYGGVKAGTFPAETSTSVVPTGNER